MSGSRQSSSKWGIPLLGRHMTIVGHGARRVGESRRADTVRRAAAVIVALIAGTMLAAWIAGLTIATRTDTLAPLSPLVCVGFLAAAAGVWALPASRRTSLVAGVAGCVVGAAGIGDVLLFQGDAINRRLFGADVPISVLTGLALMALGAAIALDGRDWPLTRKLAIAAGAIGAATAI